MRNPPRLRAPSPTCDAPVSISQPIVRLLEATCGIAPFLKAVRSGSLDSARRPDRFDLSPQSMERLLATPSGRLLPVGAPCIKGEVTSRRATGMFSLDVSTAVLDEGLIWSEMLPRGTGDAQLGIAGVDLPTTVTATLVGRRICDVVSHPLLDGIEAIIRSATSLPTRHFGGVDHAAVTEFRLDVPRTILPYLQHQR